MIVFLLRFRESCVSCATRLWHFDSYVAIAGVLVATGCTGDSWSTGGFVPRQDRSLDEDYRNGNG